MSWQREVDELRRREALAREMGGPEKVERHKRAGKLTVRERIDRVLDAGTFHEIGAVSGFAEYTVEGELEKFSPTNFLFGRGMVGGRPVVVEADDFTVRGTVPTVGLALGSVAGLGAASVVTSHYSVMVKGLSQLFVAGPPVVARTGEDVSKEELGGSEIHTRNGSIDDEATTEEDAFDRARRFLSYLPSSVYDVPARGPLDDDAARRDDWLIYFYGGGWTADASQKVTRFVDLAETFHLPCVHLVDNPGFVIGTRAERAATIRHGARALAAVYQATERAENREQLLAEITTRLDKVKSPFRTAESFLVEEIIDPRDTRPLLCEFANLAAPLRKPGPSHFGVRP